MHTTAEKTTKPSTTTVQRQSASPFFARKHDGIFGGGEKTSFFGSSFIQPKLSVSQPDDPQEKEADQMAHKVMTMPESAGTISPAAENNEELQRKEEELQREEQPKEEKEVQRFIQLKEEEEIQKQEENKEEVQRSAADKEEVQRQEEKEDVQRSIQPKLQRQEDKQEEVQRSPEEKEEVQRMCAECKDEKSAQRKEEREEVQAKLFDVASPGIRNGFALHRKEDDDNEESISRKEISVQTPGIVQRSGRGPPAHQSSFEQNLDTSRGTGTSLPGETRSFMESRFNADFSGVRVHTGETSVQMNREINAQAFTYGNDIYFNNGKYSPSTSEGQHLLAHELTHTIQQGASNHVSSPANGGGGNAIATKQISRKKKIHRSASNLAAAVTLAKNESGKVIANKVQPDGFRFGWPRLVEYFKTTMGPEKIIADGQAGDPSSVPESNIKKKGEISGVDVKTADGIGTEKGTRDHMPSWCGIFAFWALNKAGLPLKKWTLGKMTIPPEAALAPGTPPPPGFIAYKKERSHYGLVESSNGSTVTSINGNTAGDDHLGGEIQVQTHSISNWAAFIDPMKLVDGTIRNPEMGVEEKPKSLRELQKELFNVSRKKEEDKGDAEVQVQPKAGELPFSHAPPMVAKTESDKKEELQRTEEKQEEDKSVQRKEFEQGNGMAPAVTVQRKSEPKIQRGIFGRIKGAIKGAAEWVGDKLEEGKKWLLKKIRNLIVQVRGYKALCVALGYDPITGDDVARNGKNFIDAALELMPFGDLLKKKMEELGILQKAEQFVDSVFSRVDTLINGITSVFKKFWDSISLSDIKDVSGVFDRLETAFTTFFDHIIAFAKGVANDFLEFIKQALLIPLATYIKTQTRFWDLLCLIMGKDPLTDEKRPMTGANILNAFLNLSEWGVEQKKKMQETGTFNKVAAWIDKGIVIFSTAYTDLKAAFTGLWNYVNIQSLMEPVETFKKIFDSFYKPIKMVADYVVDTGIMILKIVKEVLFKWISNEAKKRKGYYLITVLISKDPFTGENVPRNTENLVKGFMLLADNGEEQFQKMKESGAIDRAVQKIDAAVKTLGFTWAYVKGLFTSLWESFTWKDFVVPVLAFGKIIQTFAYPIGRLIRFIITVVMALLEVILRMMGFPVDMVFKLIDNAKKAWNMIKSNVTGFLINILKAIKQGFSQFFDNFLKHLVNGLIDWFFDQLKDVGVTRPPDFSLKSIINLVLQVLGITMEKIWKKLADKIGADKVAKIRGALDKLEGIWKFIKDVQERGVAAIWDYIKDQLSNLWNKVLEAATNWIMEKIVTQVTVKLLSMLDPTGIMLVINSVIAIYKAIQSFIEYFERMLGIVNSFVEGILEIAEGNIKKAADYLENSMASAVPIMIGFLANQVGLGKIGKKIVEVIEKVQETVDKALDWLIDKAVNAGTAFLQKIKDAISNWWKAKSKFRDSENKEHNIFFEGEGENAVLTVRSEPQPYTKFLEIYESGLDAKSKKDKAASIKAAKDKAKEIEDKKKEQVPGTTEEEKKKKQEEKAAAIQKLLTELAKLSEPLFGTEKPKDWKKSPTPGDGGFASSMVAERIYKNDQLIGEGSEPTSAKHAVYDDIDIRRKGKGSYYIRGHLLNHNLGGPGTWANMTALSRKGNSAHEGSVESLVKAAFDSGAVIWYQVKTSGKQSPKQPTEADKPEFTRIPDINKHFDSVKKIIAAEAKVPKQVECAAFMMKKSGEEWVKDKAIVEKNIDNEIETDFGSYEVGDSVPLPKVNLTSGENTDKLSQVIDYAEKATLIPKLLNAIADKKTKDKGSGFGSYDGLAEYKILQEDGKTIQLQFTAEEKSYIKGGMKNNANVVL